MLKINSLTFGVMGWLGDEEVTLLRTLQAPRDGGQKCCRHRKEPGQAPTYGPPKPKRLNRVATAYSRFLF